LSNVPFMPVNMASPARRFTWLIDVLYDRRVKLILSAAVPPEQLYTEGPYDKVLTFLKVENFRAETKIPHGIDDIDTIAFLGGKTHNQLIEAERRGTEYALYRSGRMSQTITLDEVNANTVGQLLYFFELVTAYTGALLGIDTFNQPGVEESKVAAYAVMGFESEKHNLKREEMKTKPAPKDRYILG
ncbi:MAG: AFG1/ZapE family ATPase, partial [Clostridia bacterium]